MPFNPEGVMEIIMADEAYLKKILELQHEFHKRLATRDSPPKAIVPSLLRHLLVYDDDIVEMSLGNIGQKLKSFAREVDFSHPDLYAVFDGALADDQDFPQQCIELLSLAKFARQEGLCRIMPMLGKFVTKESLGRNIIKRIDHPAAARMHIRLLKNPEEREEIRLQKKMQVIDLTSVYRKGEEAWRAQPEDFKRFLRFDTAYQDEIQKAEKRAKRYTDLGCSALAEEILKTVEHFKENMEQAYYGFNRITMTNAAIILAKSMGFNYIPAQPPSLYVSKDDFSNKIVVQRRFFGSYNFDPEYFPVEYSPVVSAHAGTAVFCQRTAPPFLYEPRVYPLHVFWDIANESVVNTINTLEAFPDAAGKPIFDHFGVIVPSVNFPQAKNGVYSFADRGGVCQSFNSREEAVAELDAILIRDRIIFPIIVGEKDGKCYFISYFSS